MLEFPSGWPTDVCVRLQLTWLLDYAGIPQDWRHMEGWSVNTFKLINKAGEEKLVKFHFACNQGVEYMTDPEAQAAGR